MHTITTIGLDIAKSVFQVHGVDAGGQVIVRRQLKRRYVLTFFQKLSPCLVGIEAVRLGAPLVTRAPGTGSHRPADAASLREAPTSNGRRMT
jgi:transposase